MDRMSLLNKKVIYTIYHLNKLKKHNMKPPKKWKMMLLTWMIIYPLVNIVFFILMPYINNWNLLLKTLLITLIVVPIMSIILGFLSKKLTIWLRK